MTAYYPFVQKIEDSLAVHNAGLNAFDSRWSAEKTEEFWEAGCQPLVSPQENFVGSALYSQDRYVWFDHDQPLDPVRSLLVPRADGYGSLIPETSSFVYHSYWQQQNDTPHDMSMWTTTPLQARSCSPYQQPPASNIIRPPTPALPPHLDPSYRNDFVPRMSQQPSASPDSSSHTQSEISQDQVAHQPVPRERQSTYSELSVNLDFLAKLKEDDRISALERSASASHCQPPPIDSGADSDRDASACAPPPAKKQRRNRQPRSPTSEHYMPPRPKRSDARVGQVVGPATTTTPLGKSGTRSAKDTRSDEEPPLVVPSHRPAVDKSKRASASTAASAVQANGPASGRRNVKQPTKPSLACTFCKERKIACGRPPEGSWDMTCNQCERRSFRCIYTEADRLRPLAMKPLLRPPKPTQPILPRI